MVKLNARLKAPGSGEPSQVGMLPATDFTPDQVNVLFKKDVSYTRFGDIWLEIPVLCIQMNNVGVRQTGDSWDVN